MTRFVKDLTKKQTQLLIFFVYKKVVEIFHISHVCPSLFAQDITKAVFTLTISETDPSHVCTKLCIINTQTSCYHLELTIIYTIIN